MSRFKDDLPKLVVEMRDYADEAKRKRMKLNRYNIDMFNMRQDYSNKKPGQSQEFIPKISTATNKFVSFLKQGVADGDDWFSVEAEPGYKGQVITAKDVELILKDQLEGAGFLTVLEDSLQIGALQSLMIAKIGFKDCDKYSFETEESLDDETLTRKVKLKRKTKKVKKLCITTVRPENWYPDPTTERLFLIEDTFIDKHNLLKTAKENSDVYNIQAIRDLEPTSDEDKDLNLSRETDQYMYGELSFRKRLKITEVWGTLIDGDGEVKYENAYAAIGCDRVVISDPRPNDYWHGEHPYVISPIMRIAHSEWHTAMMDTPARLNAAVNDLYNLMLDGGLMSVFGIKQIRTDWLEDPSQVDNGVLPGATISVGSAAPVGAKVIERVDTGVQSSDAHAVYQLTDKELNSSTFENAYSMGTVPDRQVKATEIVAANQATTGVFSGLVKTIEDNFVAPILRKAWLTIAQVVDDLDEDRLISLLGEDKAMAIIAMTPEERFAETVQGLRFKVFGMTKTLNKINDYRKITTLLQTIAGSPELMMEFSKKFDMSKLLDEIIRNLDIDTSKIEKTQEEQAQFAAEQQMAQQMAAQGGGEGGGGGLDMSKTPNAESMTQESGPQAPLQQILSGGLTTPMGTETR